MADPPLAVLDNWPDRGICPPERVLTWSGEPVRTTIKISQLLQTGPPANAAQGGLTPTPVGRCRRANDPSSLTQHRIKRVPYMNTSLRVRDSSEWLPTGPEHQS